MRLVRKKSKKKKLKEQSNWPKSYPVKSSGKEMKNWGALGHLPISWKIHVWFKVEIFCQNSLEHRWVVSNLRPWVLAAPSEAGVIRGGVQDEKTQTPFCFYLLHIWPKDTCLKKWKNSWLNWNYFYYSDCRFSTQYSRQFFRSHASCLWRWSQTAESANLGH